MSKKVIIQHLYSETSGNKPSSLELGEIAINHADKKLFISDGNDGVIAIGEGSDCPFENGDGENSVILKNSNNVATGKTSVAIGYNCKAYGNASFAEGSYTTASGLASHAEGNHTTASGSYSHAEGIGSIASGYASHAEGWSTISSGNASHAEGSGTTASGSCSHAEGNYTTASSFYSHAEGNQTKASGSCSHAEGLTTTASGDYSHSEGTNTKAIGNFSHAEGLNTTANNHSEHASGSYNLSTEHPDGSKTFNGSDEATLFSVGNSNSSNNRHNAFEIKQSGDIYISNTDAEGEYYKKPMVRLQDLINQQGQSGDCLFEKGEGDNSVVLKNSGSVATGDTAIAIGSSCTANGNYSFTEGSNTITKDIMWTDEMYAEHKIQVGEDNEFDSWNSSIGRCRLEGNNIRVLSSDTLYTSKHYTVSTNGDIYSCDVNKYYTHYINITTKMIFGGSLSFNQYGTSSHAEGSGTKVYGTSSHAEGSGTTTYGLASHAEGYFTKARGDYSHAEGSGTKAYGASSHAEGSGTTANGITCHAEGYNTTVSGNYGSHAEGYYTTGIGSSTHAEGWQTIASGSSSHAEGNNTTASSSYSHAEGYFTKANGNNGSHAEGYYTTASGGHGSHAEGYSTTASGLASHAEGHQTTASSQYSHAEGYYTTASGYGSHSEGYETTASGHYGSHAEGQSTTASGYYSHAEGYKTTANGNYSSHAEGRETKAIGDGSHAEGYYTTANNVSEHASGYYNLSTKHPNSSATFNGSDKATLFSVGNGYNSTNYHNAIEIKQSGDIYIADTDAEGEYYEKPMVRLQDTLSMSPITFGYTSFVEEPEYGLYGPTKGEYYSIRNEDFTIDLRSLIKNYIRNKTSDGVNQFPPLTLRLWFGLREVYVPLVIANWNKEFDINYDGAYVSLFGLFYSLAASGWQTVDISGYVNKEENWNFCIKDSVT